MKKYPKYKPSSAGWIDEIPEHWESYKMKYMVDTLKYYQIGDGDHGSIKPDMYTIDGDIPYIRVQNLSWNGELNWEGMVYISKENHDANPKSKIFPKDILIAKTGATIGKLALVPDLVTEANTTSSVGKISVDQGRFDPRFILFSMMSKHFKDQIWIEAFQKSAQPGFNVDNLIFFILVCPKSKSEQIAIANFLDEKTSKIDSVIKKKKRLVELLKEERSVIINQAVTKGINPNVKLKPSGIDWLGDIPKHWEVKKLKYVAKTIIGIIYNPSEITNEGNGIFVLRASNIKNGKISYDDKVYVKKEIHRKHYTQEGDILLCARSGSADLVGKNIYIDVETSGLTFGAFMVVVRSNIGKYLHLIFNSSLFESQRGLFSTSTINQLTSDTLKNIDIIFPTELEEQNSIIVLIESETKRINDTISKIENEIDLLSEYRTALISEVVTGKIKVV